MEMDIIKISNWLYTLYGKQEGLKIKATYTRKEKTPNGVKDTEEKEGV